jgi:hypothetical protein
MNKRMYQVCTQRVSRLTQEGFLDRLTVNLHFGFRQMLTDEAMCSLF